MTTPRFTMKSKLHFLYRTTPVYRFALSCVIILLIILGGMQTSISHAQASLGDRSVTLLAIMGNKASVSINGGQPKIMSVGQEHQGIKLLNIRGQEASFQLTSGYASRQISLRIGQTPYTINPPSAAEENAQTASRATAQTPQQERRRYGEIVFQRARNNHFYTQATINGKDINFMVDTGASRVVLSAYDAQVLGIDYQTIGTPHQTSTANGIAMSYGITLPSITIQGVTLYNISASVSPGLSGTGLLGQTYLRNFKITVKGDEMILQPR